MIGAARLKGGVLKSISFSIKTIRAGRFINLAIISCDDYDVELTCLSAAAVEEFQRDPLLFALTMSD